MTGDTPDPGRRRVLGIGIAAAGSLVLSACGLSHGSSVDQAARPLKAGFSGSLVDPPLAKPDTTFTDFNGDPFPFAEKTAGELTLLFYGYTSCPDVCPIYLNTLARARDALGGGPGSRVQVLFVGVDTKRDTPEKLRSYLGAIDETFIGLTGTPALIADSLHQLKQSAPLIGKPDAQGDYTVQHPATVYAFTPDDAAHRLYPYGVRQGAWVRDLPKLAAGRYR